MSTCDSLHGRLPGRAALAVVVSLVLHATPAAAQSAEDQATARALFDEGRQLMKSGHYDQACPKLEAASKLYAGSGVLLNLGDCYEHVGRTASAWNEFAEAASVAARDGRADDLSEARRRQAAVEPKLARMILRVAHEVAGLQVKRDDAVIERGAWGVAVPVDPGSHGVAASAPGHAPWSGSASVTEPGKTVTIEVPELVSTPETAPAAGAPAPVAPTPSGEEPPPRGQYWTGRRIASAAFTGVGVVGLGVAGVLVGLAKSKDQSAQSESANRNADSTSAVNLGNAATVAASVGAAITAAGLILWLTAPDEPVQVGASPTGVLVSGRLW
jgi:hypothetical protein